MHCRKAHFCLLSIGFSVLFTSLSSLASQPQIHRQSFIDQCAQKWNQLLQAENKENVDLKKGETGFLPLTELVRGQAEISIDNLNAKFVKRLKQKDLEWNESKKIWELGHHHGQSVLGIDDPIEVVKGPMGYVILDGHHDLFLSLWAGANSISVDVKEDWSRMPPVDFWRKLQSRRLVYLRESPEALAKDTPILTEVRDNPNRYLATLIALKVKTESGKANGRIIETSGPDAPVWVKLNSSTPFVEFYIAQALSAAGIEYDSAWKSEVPSETMEKIRQVLADAVRSGKYPELNDLIVFDFKSEALAARTNEVELRRFIAKPRAGLCRNLFTM